ncbi:MAG: septum formation inhibitor Maf [Deltaproteobacteria bacterium]|nr:septum formation inhibitor Maf [Deltaproteobacteria bacterium]
MAESADAASSSLILASASPRRRWLLAALGVTFTVLSVDIDERPRSGEDPAAFARRMAWEKARGALGVHGGWVLGADTVVELDARILGKPVDGEDAVGMLGCLSGRTHLVRTGVTLLDPSGVTAEQALVTTEVSFRPLDAATIAAYVATGEPLDKAGAYAIQGEGAHLVDTVVGSYTNVIGLPLPEVATWLRARRLG